MINIFKIVSNFIYFFIMNLKIYKDRAIFPDPNGGAITQFFKRSAIERVDCFNWLLILEFSLMVISIISSILCMIIKDSKVILVISNISTILSTLVFVVIMLLAITQQVKY